MELIVTAAAADRFEASWAGRRVRCAVGRSGLAADKREGDGATPIGSFACRRILWRPDRLEAPAGMLPRRALDPHDGWCDDPADRKYNQLVGLPYPARTEALWRADHLYDVIVPLGYNDDPILAGRGSAIFLHVAHADFSPTEGCVALALDDLLAFLADGGARVTIVG